jgi:hypothetical protein
VSSSRAPTRSVGRLRLEETQSRGLAAKAAPLQGDDRRCESVRDYLNERRPGTPTGRAIWLKPKCLRVRLPPWALVKAPSGSVGNGRPLRLRTRDAVGSSPTWATENATRPRGAARSARLLVTQEIAGSNPAGDAFKDCGAVRKQAKRPSSNLGDLSVRFRPAPLEQRTTCVGWALASSSGCNPPAFGLCRFNSCPAH